MIGIIGSGFGLYGYLPAVVKSTTDSIALMEKSKHVFYQRFELAFCEPRIRWIEDESTFFKSIDTVIFSVPPVFQMNYIEKWMHLENIVKVFLEKPIGVSPKESERMLELLLMHRKKINVGYVFQFTDWARQIQNLKNDVNKISINWSFMAHHYKLQLNNWKRTNDEGGSVIRFYGIQIIALLSQIGYQHVRHSSSYCITAGDFSRWNAVFMKEGFPDIEVEVDSNSLTQCFSIYGKYNNSLKNDYKITMSDPFEQNQTSNLDRRVNILSDLILNDEVEDLKVKRFRQINALWQEVERVNQIME